MPRSKGRKVKCPTGVHGFHFTNTKAYKKCKKAAKKGPLLPCPAGLHGNHYLRTKAYEKCAKVAAAGGPTPKVNPADPANPANSADPDGGGGGGSRRKSRVLKRLRRMGGQLLRWATMRLKRAWDKTKFRTKRRVKRSMRSSRRRFSRRVSRFLRKYPVATASVASIAVVGLFPATAIFVAPALAFYIFAKKLVRI